MQSFRRPKLTKTQLPEVEPTYYTYVSGNQNNVVSNTMKQGGILKRK